MPQIPDLVKDSKITTTFHNGYTQHVIYRSGNTPAKRRVQIEEKWTRRGLLGAGGYGKVWRETCSDERGGEKVRAVKEIRKTSGSSPVDYYRELEAITKFSNVKVRSILVHEGITSSG